MKKSWGIALVIALLLGAITYDVWKNSRFVDDTVWKAQVEKVLMDQMAAWNNGDLKGFLSYYDMKENITFYSDDKVRRGWVAMSEGYTKKYGEGKTVMGKLAFDDLDFTVLSPEAVMVRGRWTTSDTPKAGTGLFTILVRKTDNGWKVVHDHTSSKPDPK